MKTSQKLLITVAGLFVALLIAGLVILRQDTQKIMAELEMRHNYVEVPVEPFDRLDFSGTWIVMIRQGREHKVEWDVDEHADLQPNLENRDGTLHFNLNSVSEKPLIDGVYAKITTPSLQVIQSLGKAQISIRNFNGDTLNVVLRDGAGFKGHNSHFKNLSLDTSGDARVLLTDDMVHSH